MAGGLLQLSNGTGAQDKILTAKPEVTFFKSMYRQHTNFAIESIPQTLQGEPNFGQSTACTIARNGDLVHRIYLELVFEDYTNASGDLPSPSNFGYKMIKSACLEIGGTTIDKHYGEWMELWSMLSTPAGVMKAHSAMVGEADKFNTTGSGVRVCIPLHFWFCRNPGLALPLIALQFHEVKLRIDFNEKLREHR